MRKHGTSHLEEIARLRKIEGQVRGILRMIEERRYCVDILTQLASVRGALRRVEERILERHLRGCVQDSFNTGKAEARRKNSVSLLKERCPIQLLGSASRTLASTDFLSARR